MTIAWYLVGDRRTGSSRMECYHVHDLMIRRGDGSSVIRWSPARYGDTQGLSPAAELTFLKQHDVNLVVFQKLSDAVSRELAMLCREHGIPTVFVLCDYLDDLAMVPICTATIVTSTSLLDLVRAAHPQSDVTFCQYGTEAPPDLRPAYAERVNAPKKLVYLGTVRLPRDFGFLNHIPNTRLTTIGPCTDYDRRLNSSVVARLRTALAWHLGRARQPNQGGPRNANRPLPTTRAWALDSVYDDMAACDIGVIPLLPEQWSSPYGRMKSNSRLLSMWGVGLATIASPLRAYLETINHGVDGFIAESRKDWARLVKLLRDDGDLRREMGRKARIRAFEEFGLTQQYSGYMTVFRRVSGIGAPNSPE
jgi:hypothetical protein